MEFRQDNGGKTVFLTVDNRSVPHNPLYKAFKAKSFTDNDVTLHFYILDLLADGDALTVKQVMDRLSVSYYSAFSDSSMPDESTVREKLKEYTRLGVLECEKQGRESAYRRSADQVDLVAWRDAVDFFSEADPLGVVGSYLLDRVPEGTNHFSYKHHYLLNVLDSEMLYELLLAIRERRSTEITTFVSRRNEERLNTVLPLQIYISTQTGRQYLLAYHYRLNRPMFFRIDNIRKVKAGEVDQKWEKHSSFRDQLNEDKTLAVWLRPQIFQMDASRDVINILFLDEITAAPQSVQAAAYQITLDRTVGEHRLPENCIVIAAGNRITDRSVAFNMPKALANRLCHIEIKGDSGAWHDWAVQTDIHPIVMGFLDYNSSVLNGFDPSSDNLAFPTPRTWEMVSNILRDVSENITEVYPLIAGCVGAKTAATLQTWYEIYQRIPDMKDVFGNGKKKDLSSEPPELLYATVAAMVDYARRGRTLAELKNSVEYALKMPMEYRFRLFSDYYNIRHIRQDLQNDRTFSEWIEYNREEGRLK